MSDFYQQIGSMVVVFSKSPQGKMLLYSEVEDCVISADVFIQDSIGSPVRFRFAPRPLRDLVYQFWETGEDLIAPRSWAAFQLVIEGGKFTVDFTYPDKLVAEEPTGQRRSRVVREHFPDATIDYSHPD